MMEDKIAIIIDNSKKIPDEKNVYNIIKKVGLKTDRYIYINEEADYDMSQEIEDLKPFYKGVYVV